MRELEFFYKYCYNYINSPNKQAVIAQGRVFIFGRRVGYG